MPSFPSIPAALLVLLCAAAPSFGEQKKPADSGRKITPTMFWTGSDSRFERRDYQRIEKTSNWEPLWYEHAGVPKDEVQGKPAPQIDFEKQMVIAVTLGKSYNCEGIRLLSVTEDSASITIKYYCARYNKLIDVDDVTPFGFVILPRSSKKVVLVEGIKEKGKEPRYVVRKTLE
jgi:hypothetical protein